MTNDDRTTGREFADRTSTISASGIRKMFNLIQTMPEAVNLTIGQADFDVPAEIKRAAAEAIAAGRNKYTVTEGIPALRERIARELAETRGMKVNPAFADAPNDILVTCGVSGGLVLAFLCLLQHGDEILLPDPHFVMYRHLVSLCGATPVYYDTYPDFHPKREVIEPLITGATRHILVNSPSNPTGAVYSAAEIEMLAKLAGEHNLTIFSDEIYDTFVYDEESPHISPATRHKDTIVFGGFSKSMAMPGWRIGYAAGPADIIEKMMTLQQFTFVCAPSFAQHAAVAGFDVDMRPFIEDYHKKRDMVYEGLRENFEISRPGGSFYFFPASPWESAEDFIKAAFDRQVVVIPGAAFSMRNTHFRLSFAVGDEDLKRGIDILNEIAVSRQ